MRLFTFGYDNQKGLSLIELMIAMVLGLLVVGAIIQLFVGSRATQMSNEALARVQENGRFSMELMKQELRGVNARGFCAGRVNIKNHLNDDCANQVSTIYDDNHTVVGWEYEGTERGESYDLPASLDPSGTSRDDWRSVWNDEGTIRATNLPALLGGKVVPGSDVLVVRTLNKLNLEISGVKNNNQLDIAGGSDTIPPGQVVVVANCGTGADMFQQSKRKNDSANPTRPAMNCSATAPGNKPPGPNPWGTEHDGASAVYTISTAAYYVGYNATTQEPGLYRISLTDETPVAEELVEGVENLQILYGYSFPAEDGGDGQSVDVWLPADEVPDWEFVIGARLGMLIRSPDNMAGESVQRTFDLASTQVTHQTDGRLRQPFFASISLRNSQLVM